MSDTKEETNDTIEEVVTRKRGRPRTRAIQVEKPKVWANDKIAYFKKYYLANTKCSCMCESCNKEFTSQCALKYHQENCKKCKMLKMERELQELRKIKELKYI